MRKITVVFYSKDEVNHNYLNEVITESFRVEARGFDAILSLVRTMYPDACNAYLFSITVEE